MINQIRVSVVVLVCTACACATEQPVSRLTTVSRAVKSCWRSSGRRTSFVPAHSRTAEIKEERYCVDALPRTSTLASLGAK